MNETIQVERYTETPDCTLWNASPEDQLREDIPRGFAKPIGTWISIPGDDDWPTWCRDAGFGLDALGYRHVFELNTSDVLMISSVADLDTFHAAHAMPVIPAFNRLLTIDWQEVARQYKGVVIAPYRWERRFDYLWYYGWDCSCGCIWDTSALVKTS